jgi:predicted alpha/beta superfamily hydrolase
MNHHAGKNKFHIYSKGVSDSFEITVNLPNDYKDDHVKKYPVAYLLDANLYFDIIATTLTKYSDVGLAPSVILVGIGYKDFPTMDSLRNRDYTYPMAIPEYEMSVSGGAPKFSSFINQELIPEIDKKYKTDTSKRVLMGHSLGGYFTLYSLLEKLSGKKNGFNGYIAASPSLHYNRFWLLNHLKENHNANDNREKLKIYITYGGMEDAESEGDSTSMKLDELIHQLTGLFAREQYDHVTFKSDIYSNLDHMDTQFPTFIKGLQWELNAGN